MKLLIAMVMTAAVSLSLRATQWTLTTANFTTLKKALANDASGDLTFAVPTDGSSMNYLYGTAPRKLSGMLVATFRIDLIAGSPVFLLSEPEPCGDPPSAHFFVWANHQGKGDFDRWWGMDAYTLQAGEQTVSIPLDPTRWTAVYRTGNAFPDEFTKAMANVSSAGLTFGGQTCNYGHGVYVSGGSARFTLESFSVQ